MADGTSVFVTLIYLAFIVAVIVLIIEVVALAYIFSKKGFVVGFIFFIIIIVSSTLSFSVPFIGLLKYAPIIYALVLKFSGSSSNTRSSNKRLPNTNSTNNNSSNATRGG